MPWARHLAPDYEGRIRQFVTDWPRLGLIEPQPGPPHDSAFPAEMHVERESGFPEGPSPHALAMVAASGGAGGGGVPTRQDLDAAAAAERDMPTQPPLDDWRAHL